MTRYRLDTACTEPIRSASYESNHQARIGRIAALQQQLDETDDTSERRDIEDSIAHLQKQDQKSEESLNQHELYNFEISNSHAERI